ncbi:MAG: sugar phosphate isomerase/epimerase [Clostridia bacterium]|nr:sugar phosphate isomerase/epimerase [Clostridia bacterium]
MKLGVISDCFRRSMEESIALAGELRLDGIQMYAVSGEFCPEQLLGYPERIRRYRELLTNHGLTVSALCGDLGGHGFEIASENPGRIEKTNRIVDLACELGTSVVTTHIGVIPQDEKSEKYAIMLSALRACGSYAAGKGVTLAIETGPEVASTLANFVDKIEAGVGVNLDPANFVMVTGQDPTEAVYLLKDHIVHTHLKDGKMLKRSDPVEIYRCFAEGGIEALNVADYFIETPVGEGDVDFRSYIQALRDIGYDGFLTIERETGADPSADIRKAADYARANFGL